MMIIYGNDLKKKGATMAPLRVLTRHSPGEIQKNLGVSGCLCQNNFVKCVFGLHSGVC
jgi:hypothetical protein